MRKQKAKHTIKTTADTGKETKQKHEYRPKSVFIYLFQILLTLAIVIGCVIYTDSLGLYNPDSSFNHVERKWNSFYKMTEKDTIDVVIVGNSIAFTGLNPKNLSEALGVTCFILAAPGTSVSDSYYCLKEALSRTKPKIAIIETRNIDDYNPDDEQDYAGHYMNNSRSFKSRKNILMKMEAMPEIFNMDDYPAIWSNTITNHDYIFNNEKQIKKNIEETEKTNRNTAKAKYQKTKKKKEKLYLGRFVRFPKGLTDSTIALYDSLGPSIDGKNEKVSEHSKLYVNKIIDLCKENGVTPLFVTLPVYHKHISNYEYKHQQLRDAIPSDCYWIDYQQKYDTAAYTPECFENTIEKNQHISYIGSIILSYQLAHDIHDSLKIELPKRYLSQHWQEMFYGEEGYFYNYPPKESDTKNVLLFKNVKLSNCTINNVQSIKEKDMQHILVQMQKGAFSNCNQIYMNIIAKIGNKTFPIAMELEKIKKFNPISNDLFSIYLKKDVEIISIMKVTDKQKM